MKQRKCAFKLMPFDEMYLLLFLCAAPPVITETNLCLAGGENAHFLIKSSFNGMMMTKNAIANCYLQILLGGLLKMQVKICIKGVCLCLHTIKPVCHSRKNRCITFYVRLASQTGHIRKLKGLVLKIACCCCRNR